MVIASEANGDVTLPWANDPAFEPELTLPVEEAARVRAAYEAADVILEYGSGGSTVLGARMPGKLVLTVESDFNWALDLQGWLDQANLPSAAIVHYQDIGQTGSWGRPVDCCDWRKFHHYPTKIWDAPFFRHPDVVLIDGRFRPACFATVALCIKKPVTVLFDDYRDRALYHAVEEISPPVAIIGRMAEFHLNPRVFSGEDFGYLMSLMTQVSYADRYNPYRK